MSNVSGNSFFSSALANTAESDSNSETLTVAPGAGPPALRNQHRTVVKDWANDNAILLQLGEARNPWRLKDAFEGVQVFGGTGSGKTSGSGKAVAKAFIKSNFGGLVLTAKRDEAATWQRYMEESNRLSDLVIFPRSRGTREVPMKFNFLDYAFQNETGGVGMTENLVNLFCSVLEVAERKGGGGNDGYWMRATKQLLRNAIDLCVLALGTVNLEDIRRIVATAPQTLEAASVTDPQQRATSSACLALIDMAAANRGLTDLQRHDLNMTRNFWEREFPALAVETRSGVVSMFSTMADCFLRGRLYELFCQEYTQQERDDPEQRITPEECWLDGKVIVLDLPVKEFYELGQFAQVIFKFLWQRAVERRVPQGLSGARAEASIRPVFLWADEAQFFANSFDSQFQSTARSSRASTVYLTQNLPSYHSVFGGANARADADMFLGNLVTKIFHANGDPTTNQWAADTIGKELRTNIQSLNADFGASSRAQSQPAGQAPATSFPEGQGRFSRSIQYAFEPQDFTMLRRGGVPECLVDGVIFQGGRTWTEQGSVKNYVRHSFNQNLV